MVDGRPYEVYVRSTKKPFKPPLRFWTLGEAMLSRRTWNNGQIKDLGIRKRHPRNKTQTLQDMVNDRRLEHVQVFYVGRCSRNGWFVNDIPGEEGMQLLGGSYAQAIEMIQSGALEILFRRERV